MSISPWINKEARSKERKLMYKGEWVGISVLAKKANLTRTDFGNLLKNTDFTVDQIMEGKRISRRRKF